MGTMGFNASSAISRLALWIGGAERATTRHLYGDSAPAAMRGNSLHRNRASKMDRNGLTELKETSFLKLGGGSE